MPRKYHDRSGQIIRGGRWENGTTPPDPPPVDPPPQGPGLPLSYVGGFRIKGGTFGMSRASETNATFWVDDTGYWVSGHAHHDSVGKFNLVTPQAVPIGQTPIATNRVPFFSAKWSAPIPYGADTGFTITGLFQDGNYLYVFVNMMYENSVVPTKVLRVDVTGDVVGTVEGLYGAVGNSRSTGQPSFIPEDKRALFGGKHMMLTAGSHNILSIDSRKSLGPALFTWDGTWQNPVPAQEYMAYRGWDESIGSEAEGGPEVISHVWNPCTYAACGWIQGDDVIYVGQIMGLEHGLRYIGGYQPFDPDDRDPYYWKYHLTDILNATRSYDPFPYEYGKLSIPELGSELYSACWRDGKLYCVRRDDYSQGGEPKVFVAVYDTM